MKRQTKTVKIGKHRYRVELSRFPWQGYGWRPHKNNAGPKAPLNPSGARFGAGWAYCLGVSVGASGNTVLLDLLVGTVRISREAS